MVMKKKPAALQVGMIVFVTSKVEEINGTACSWDNEGKMEKIMADATPGTIQEIWKDKKYGERISVVYENGYVFTYLPECFGAPGKKAKPKKIDLRAVIKEHKAIISAWGPGGVSSFIIIGDKGTVKKHQSTICHAAYRNGLNGKAGENYHTMLDSVANVKGNCIEGTQAYKDAKRYINDILRESPWAHCFKTKTAVTALKSCVEYDLNNSTHHIAGAFTALREGSENHGCNSAYVFLRGKGYDFGIAYMMSRFYNISGKGWVKSASWNSGHKTTTEYMNLDQLLHFCKFGYTRAKRDQDLATKGNYSFKVYNSIAEEHQGKADVGSFFREHMEMTKVGEGWAAVNVVTEETVLKVCDMLVAKQEKMNA